MKNIILIFTAILFFYSCSNIEQPVKSETDIYKVTGIEHNKGLEFIQNKLSAVINESKNLSEDSITTLIITFVAEYLENECPLDKPTTSIEQIISESIEIMKYSERVLHDSIWSTQSDALLTAQQKELLLEIGNTLNNSDFISNITETKLSNIRSTAITILPTDQQPAVLAALEVGLNSYYYWRENYENWAIMFGNKDIPKLRWGKILGCDAMGAVLGIIYGPWGAAGGAIACSALACYDELR